VGAEIKSPGSLLFVPIISKVMSKKWRNRIITKVKQLLRIHIIANHPAQSAGGFGVVDEIQKRVVVKSEVIS
jgi:hypothetical protein